MKISRHNILPKSHPAPRSKCNCESDLLKGQHQHSGALLLKNRAIFMPGKLCTIPVIGPAQGEAVPVLADLIRRHDGTFVLQPHVTGSQVDMWVSPKRAAQLIGIRGHSIYRLLNPNNPFLVYKRPLKSRSLVSLRSVRAYIQATSDPDFWDDSYQQKRLVESVQKTMRTLAHCP